MVLNSKNTSNISVNFVHIFKVEYNNNNSNNNNKAFLLRIALNIP